VTNKRSLLAIENLISAIGLLIQRDAIRNEVFLVADATPVSLPEIIARLRHGMGRSANLISIPPALLSDLFGMWRISEHWEKNSSALASQMLLKIIILTSPCCAESSIWLVSEVTHPKKPDVCRMFIARNREAAV
jgi:hypothetical protein